MKQRIINAWNAYINESATARALLGDHNNLLQDDAFLRLVDNMRRCQELDEMEQGLVQSGDHDFLLMTAAATL